MKPIKIFVTCFLLITLFVYIIDYEKLFTYLGDIRFEFLLILLLAGSSTRFLLAYQIELCLQPFHLQNSTWSIFRAQTIATFYSFFLPGDLVSGGVTWHLLSRDSGKRAQIASILVYVRLVNIVTLVPFALLGLFLETRLLDLNVHYFVLVLSALLLVLSSPFWWRSAADAFNHMSTTLFRRININRLSEANTNLWQSIYVFRTFSIKKSAMILLLSIFIQLLGVAGIYIITIAIQVDIPIVLCLWLMPLIMVINLLPITVKGLGVREISIVYLLDKFYSVPSEKSVLISFLFLFTALAFGVWGGILNMMDKGKITRTKNNKVLIKTGN